MTDASEWITTKQASQLTGLSRGVFSWLARGGRIKCEKRDGWWYFDKESVLAYAAEMERLGTSRFGPKRKKRKEEK